MYMQMIIGNVSKLYSLSLENYNVFEISVFEILRVDCTYFVYSDNHDDTDTNKPRD